MVNLLRLQVVNLIGIRTLKGKTVKEIEMILYEAGRAVKEETKYTG